MSSSETSSPCYVWDFTIPSEKITKQQLIAALKKLCKRWVIQLEKGEQTGFIHWQCRASFTFKTRKAHTNPHIKAHFPKETHFSLTSTENKDCFDYVSKDNTALEEPICDATEIPAYIPRQIREINKLRPWQQHVVDTANDWDTRTINILYDPTGNHGKSMLKTYIGVNKIGRAIPFSNDYKDIMRMVMDTDKMPLYIIDIPRALRKDQLFQFFSGVETIKDGYAYDDRYHFKEEYFDCPVIWIFMNKLPELESLSSDRWKIWSFNNDGDLELIDKPFDQPTEQLKI